MPKKSTKQPQFDKYFYWWEETSECAEEICNHFGYRRGKGKKGEFDDVLCEVEAILGSYGPVLSKKQLAARMSRQAVYFRTE